MSVRINNNPLRDIIVTTDPIHYDPVTNEMTFTHCTYKQRYSFSRVVWSFETNTLVFYKGNTGRHSVCLAMKAYECALPHSVTDTEQERTEERTEQQHYDTVTEQLFNSIKDNVKIEHFERVHDTKTRHFITLIGEYHGHEGTPDHDALVQHLLHYFDTFVKSETVIDLFLEVPFLFQTVRDKDVELFDIYNVLHDTYEHSQYVRLHRVDIRSTHGVKMLLEFKSMLERYNDLRLLESAPFLQEMSVFVTRHILPLLKTDTSNSNLVRKQYTKMNRGNVYTEMFRDLFSENYDYFVHLLNYIQNKIKDPFDLTEKNKEVLYQYLHTFLTTQYINDIALSFMDMYTIGRMLKRNYTYCVFYGGTAHAKNLSKLINVYFKEFNFIQ